jgi:uncharacterized membrane protein
MDVQGLLDTWASLYANHPVLRTALAFGHVGGLVVAGGAAVEADRLTLRRARRVSHVEDALFESNNAAHRTVVTALVAVVVSGILLFGADVDTYLYSKVYWTKMTLMVLLLANGALMLRAERRIDRGDARAWAAMVRTAWASLLLWTLTTAAGVALPNLG